MIKFLLMIKLTIISLSFSFINGYQNHYNDYFRD
jgi:hypothetical protein